MSNALGRWDTVNTQNGGDWRNIRNIYGMITGAADGMTYGPGLKGFMAMIKDVATPDVTKLSTAVEAIGTMIANDLVNLSKALGKWKDGATEGGGWRDLSNVYGLISGGDADGPAWHYFWPRHPWFP